MAVINELISIDAGAIDFGNYELTTKTKKDGVEYQGDIYKIKTWGEITKLEKNGMFVYESVPGTAVHGFMNNGTSVMFEVEGTENTSITLELEPECDYKLHIDDIYVGKNKTNLGGKLNISVELKSGVAVKVLVEKATD